MNSPRMCLYATFLFLAPVMLTHAQWNSDPSSNNPICLAGNIQKATQIVSDGKGGAILCWSDERSAQNFYSVYAQRIDRDGFVRWAENGIAVSPVSDSQARPEIISDGAGGAIIVWSDTRSGTEDVYAQRIDSSGNALWKAEGVSVADGSDPSQRRPAWRHHRVERPHGQPPGRPYLCPENRRKRQSAVEPGA